MPRIGRIVVKDHPHHITQRGNYKQTVFIENADYLRYLSWMDMYAKKNSLLFLAYCIMPNHVHYIAIPELYNSLSKTFNTCHMRYSQYFNKKRGFLGHLWQGRFYSCALDETHLYAAIRYIENNPVRAGLVKSASDWQWSSASHHISGEKTLLSIADIGKYLNIDNWEYYLNQCDEFKKIASIKANTLTGRPLGNDVFVAKIEQMFNMRIKPLPIGRPKKEI